MLSYEVLMNWLDAGQKVATGLAALTAAYVAAQGLRAWRVQLHGKTEYDLARRLLRAVFKVRDQIAYVRGPFVSAGEMVEAYKAAGIAPEGVDMMNDGRRRDQLVYQRRWEPLVSALSDLSVEILEAEVLWGSPVRNCEKELLRLVTKLNAALTVYIRDVNTGHRHDEAAAERMERHAAIVFAGGTDDEFAIGVAKAVAAFEELLRPNLRLGRQTHARRAA
jgi:hypothetical protein